jgi:ribosomal protein S18 acetylase RimI-like enzyme
MTNSTTSDKNIEVRFLGDSYIEQVYDCYMEAFRDYYLDISYMTLGIMQSRARMDRVDYSYSVGAFTGDKMIGFILIAIDRMNEELCAFDAGTGVIGDFRGKGVTGAMFNYGLSKLGSIGIKKFILEVLQENQPAIKAYQKAGFSIARDFVCYRIQPKNFVRRETTLDNIVVRTIPKTLLKQYLSFLDYEVSWEYAYSAIKNIREKLTIKGAFTENNCVGFIVFYPTLNWIFMLGVKEECNDKGIEYILLEQIIQDVSRDVQEIKFNNIPPRHRLCNVLEAANFELYTTQYEMIYTAL